MVVNICECNLPILHPSTIGTYPLKSRMSRRTCQSRFRLMRRDSIDWLVSIHKKFDALVRGGQSRKRIDNLRPILERYAAAGTRMRRETAAADHVDVCGSSDIGQRIHHVRKLGCQETRDVVVQEGI